MRIAILTLDAHLTAAFDAAASRLVREMPGLEVSLHIAATWGEGLAAERARTAVAQADIIVATHLFVEEQINAILPTIVARRDAARAVVCLMSSGSVMRQTRMGKFQMSGKGGGDGKAAPASPSAWSPIAILKRLGGAGKPGQSTGEAQMRQLKRIPQLLRFIPGTAQDVRAYYMIMQYWLAGSEENLVNLVRLLATRYGGAKGVVEAAAPVEYPETGLYHPDLPGLHLTESLAALPDRGTNGRVGLLLMRSYLLGGNTAHYDGVIRALEARGHGRPGIRRGARRPTRHRALLPRPARHDRHRRLRVPHRVFAGRRPGVQRCRGGASGAWRPRRSVLCDALARIRDDR